MSNNFRHLDAATLLGAWPLSPHPDGAGYSFQPEVTLRSATIRAIKREPALGFSLDGLAFKIYVDAGGPFTVNFSGGDPWSLDDVVAEINTDTSLTVAYNENGFLLLKSPTTGDGSYLRLESITSAEHVFDLLGLFSETESYAGDVTSPGHPDPTRQVSYPGQATMPWGGAFDAAAFNRVAIAMALNSDRTAGLIDRKRVAVRKEAEISYNGTDLHIQIPDMVYTGPVTPKMEDLIAILDDSHNEILVEQVVTELEDLSVSATVSTDADSGVMIVSSPDDIFTGVTAAGEWYVVLVGAPSPLNGLQLKILNRLSSDEVIVQNVNPVTGDREQLNGALTSLKTQQISTDKVTAVGLYKESGSSPNVNQRHESIYSGAVARVEKNNRIYCSGADFAAVGVGDEVVWSGSTVTDPWSNNGTYRVLRKVDAKTLDLIGEDGDPVILNPTEGVVSGVVDVQTDGEFWDQPYIKFVDDDVKPPAGTIRVIYLGMSNVREALTGDPTGMAGSVRYAQETDFQVQKALIGIAGPSMDTFDDVLTWLYGDRRRSLEGAFNRLDYEHYDDDSGKGSGRHSNIRPDTIDMFPSVSGETVIVRNADAGEDAGHVDKIVLKDSTTPGVNLFRVDSDGSVMIGEGTFSAANDLAIHRVDGNIRVDIWAQTTGEAILDMKADDDQVGLTLEAGGTGNWSFLHLGTDAGYFEVYVDGGDFLNRMRFDDWNGESDVLVLQGAAGRVGIADDDPQFPLSVKARTTAQHELQNLKGYDAGQSEVSLQFETRPTRTTGYLRGTDNGAVRALELDGYDRIYFKNNAGYNWELDSSGHLIPYSGKAIGRDGSRVSTIFAEVMRYSAIGYPLNITTNGFGIGTAAATADAPLHVKASTSLHRTILLEDSANGASIDFIRSGQSLGTAAQIGFVSSGTAQKLEIYNFGTSGVIMQNVNAGDMELYSYGNIDLRYRRGTSASLTIRTNNVIVWSFDPSGHIVPNGDSLNLGESASTNRVDQLFGQFGEFIGNIQDPASQLHVCERNAQNATVARGRIDGNSAGPSVVGNSWNLSSTVTWETNVHGENFYRVHFSEAVDPDNSVLVTLWVDISGVSAPTTHETYAEIEPNGTYVDIMITAGVSTTYFDFTLVVIGRPETMPSNSKTFR